MQQRKVCRWRFRIMHIKDRRGVRVGTKPRIQRRMIHQLAARGIDQQYVRLQLREYFGIHHVTIGGAAIDVDRQDVRGFEQSSLIHNRHGIAHVVTQRRLIDQIMVGQSPKW